MKKYFVGLLASVALAWSAGSSAVLIDSFETVQDNVAVFGPSPNEDSGSGAGPGIIGGQREIGVNLTQGDATAAAAARIVASLLDISNSSTANSIVSVMWDNAANVDLTDAGQSTGLFLSLPSPIDNALNIEFTINGASSSSINFPNGSSGNDFFFPFSDFNDPGVFTSVTSIAMVLSDGPAWDAQVDFVETRPTPVSQVPESSSIALLGIGLVSIGLLGRRRKG